MQPFFLYSFIIVLPEFYNKATAITLRVTELYIICNLINCNWLRQ